jgi:hypothetical protein
MSNTLLVDILCEHTTCIGVTTLGLTRPPGQENYFSGDWRNIYVISALVILELIKIIAVRVAQCVPTHLQQVPKISHCLNRVFPRIFDSRSFSHLKQHTSIPFFTEPTNSNPSVLVPEPSVLRFIGISEPRVMPYKHLDANETGRSHICSFFLILEPWGLTRHSEERTMIRRTRHVLGVTV